MVVADLLGTLNLEAGYDYHLLTSSFLLNGRELNCELIWQSNVNPNFTYELRSSTVRTSSPRPYEHTTTLETEASIPLLPPLPSSQHEPQTQPPSSSQQAPTASEADEDPHSSLHGSPPATSDPVPSSTHSSSSSSTPATLDPSSNSSANRAVRGAYICQVPGCGIAHRKP